MHLHYAIERIPDKGLFKLRYGAERERERQAY